METLKNLPLLNTGTTPISAAVYNFYITAYGNGTGENGTFLLTDFIGTTIGDPVGDYFQEAAEIIARRQADGTLTTLATIYNRMLKSVNGTYGPVPSGPIVIPAGPGAGTYTEPQDAINALVPLANTEISALVSVMGNDSTRLNTLWDDICDRVIFEVNNLNKCSVNLTSLITGDQYSAQGLVTTLPGLGLDTTQGGAAVIFEEIADTTTLAGQAIIGCMREGRNNDAMDNARIGRDNVISDTPSSVPAQATISKPQYTVAEARALVKQINQAV